MLDRFRLRYPALHILCSSMLFSLLFPLLALLDREDGPISQISGMAFLLSLGCISIPVQMALIVEKSLPDCPPFWRVRYGAANAAWYFACFCLLAGFRFPSFDVVAGVSGAIVFGVLMTKFGGKEAPTPDLFDTERPFLRSQFTEAFRLIWGGVLLLIALGLSVIDIGGTAPAIFVFIIASGLVIPFPFRNKTGWHEGDLLTVIGFAAATAGLFLA